MPVTPLYGLPYLDQSDEPDIPAVTQGISEGAETELLRIESRILARARRETSSSASTGSEVGVLRLDGIAVSAGRGYRISTSGLNMDTTVDNDIASARIRVRTGGLAATASSDQVGQVRQTIDDAVYSNIAPLVVHYYPTSDTTISVLLSVERIQGSGSVIMYASSVDILDLVVTDDGPIPSDTGVVL